MMGYARTAADLALGRTVDELHTGDLARQTDAGLYEIVGRLDRHTKLFGLRIDLDRVESALTAAGVRAACAAGEDCLVVAVEEGPPGAVACDLAMVQGVAARRCGLPGRAVQVRSMPQLPVTGNGKVDYRAVAGLQPVAARCARPSTTAPATTDCPVRPVRRAARAGRRPARRTLRQPRRRLAVLRRDVRAARGRSSVSCPAHWHLTPIRDLAPARRTRRGMALDTSVALRALAIVLIVGTHANLLTLQGGAHLLLAVAGFNFARFQLSAATRGGRTPAHRGQPPAGRRAERGLDRRGRSDAGDATASRTSSSSTRCSAPDSFTERWHFWFLETLVWTLVAALAVLAVPVVDRAERRAPFGFALAALAATLAVRFAFVGVESSHAERYTPWAVVWFFALGWAVARATTVPRRLLLTAVTAATVVGFFGEARTARRWSSAASLVLAWVATVRVPRLAGRAAGVLASSSLYIYLTHWQVYPHLENRYPLLAVLASLAVGIGYWLLVTRATGYVLPRIRPAVQRVSRRS